MITAVDSNVLIDLFRNDPKFGALSEVALAKCLKEGRLVVCDVVWAELAAVFPSQKSFAQLIQTLPIEYVPLNQEAASLAGEMWRRYRKQGGQRTRVLADFLIAAYALHQCDRLLTRDRGFYREYFKKLRLIDPSA